MNAGKGAQPLGQRVVKPERILALGFFLLILLGGALLSLPAAGAGGRSIGVKSGVFTATSAVCVTGLTLIDAGTQLSLFGQIVLLCLIQIGGLGFMAFATLAMVALGKRISLRSRALLRDSMNQTTLSGMVRLTLWFALLAFGVELIGACFLMTRFIPRFGVTRGAWYGLFHAVSAFCNAGFDLIGNGQSLVGYQTDPTVMLTVCALIILGGLGFSVMVECAQNRFRFRRLSLHAKLVLCATGFLLALGTALVCLLEWRNPATLDGMSAPQKLMNGFFQAVTLRTAGYASVNQAGLRDATKLLGAAMMFVGASPASTGGGVKTTTAFLMLILAWNVARGSERITVFRREIGFQTVRRAVTILLIGAAAAITGACLISVIEPAGKFSMIDLLYEAVSAFSTTGLSSANTAALTTPSQLLLLPLMYFGRVGPLTLAFALASRLERASAGDRVHYPEEKIMIG